MSHARLILRRSLSTLLNACAGAIAVVLVVGGVLVFVAPFLPRPFDDLLIKYGMAVGAVAAVIVAVLVGRGSWTLSAEHQRRLEFRCIACGYDLRASADRCPECGRPMRTDEEGPEWVSGPD